MSQAFYRAMFCGCICCCLSISTYAQNLVIRAGVAPDLTDGMYAKLITHVGEQLDLPVDIVEVPLQRRLIMLAEGKLDLAVGLFKTPSRNSQFTFIEPEYTVRADEDRLYLLRDNFALLRQGQALKGSSVAILRGSSTYKNFVDIDTKQLFETHSLVQSIDLLLKQRVDYFIYARDAADKKLLELGVKHRVVESVVKPQQISQKKVYLAISKHSFLDSKRAELSAITSALKAGEYDRLYNQLYQSKLTR